MKTKGTYDETRNLFSTYIDSGNIFGIRFPGGAATLDIEDKQSSSNVGKLTTNRLFRDLSAWYHIVFVWDSANAAATDRMRLYVNGVEETSFATDTQPPIDSTSVMNANTRVVYIGGRSDDAAYNYEGSMSHIQFVDGLALAPTEFGEFDSTSGIWKIKTGCYATPGNNGFCLKMEDRTNLDLDSSSNAHTFTTSGTLTATYDNPSNNFCTLGGEIMSPRQPTDYLNGNTTAYPTSTDISVCGNLGMSKGAWYWETKVTIANNLNIGLVPAALINESGATLMGWDQGSGNNALNADPSIGTRRAGNMYEKADGSQVATTTTSFVTGDIIGLAFNATTGAFRLWKNGVEMTGSPYTLGDGNYATTWGTAGAILPGFRIDGAADTTKIECNFGNGYFGTTAVVSTNADAAGIGSFEYEVPASHYALCTKNIKVYG